MSDVSKDFNRYKRTMYKALKDDFLKMALERAVASFRANRNIEIVYGDLEKNEGIAEALHGVDTVVHCAARTIGNNYIEYYMTNTIGTAHLIKAMNKRRTKRILYLSSHAACGPCCEKKPLRNGIFLNKIN